MDFGKHRESLSHPLRAAGRASRRTPWLPLRHSNVFLSDATFLAPLRQTGTNYGGAS
jgi:hypothetical protein